MINISFNNVCQNNIDKLFISIYKYLGGISMSKTYGEVHDHVINSYFVDFENAKIILKFHWTDKEKALYMEENEPYIDSIIFVNVMGYDIESGVHNNQMKKENTNWINNNYLDEIEEYTLSEFLEEYNEYDEYKDKILTNISNRVPFQFNNLSEFMKKLNDYNLNIYFVNTGTADLGLCGWILSEKMEIVLKS